MITQVKTAICGTALALVCIGTPLASAQDATVADEATGGDAAQAEVMLLGKKKENTYVITGFFIRGIQINGRDGVPGQRAGQGCSFVGQQVNQAGRMEDASVNCRSGGTLADTLRGLPEHFNAYCMIAAGKATKSWSLLPAERDGNKNHCLLSNVSPADATRIFGQAIWR